MARLPPVLRTDDLPLAELCAARIDGDLVRLGDGWCAIDEPDLPATRAAAVAPPAPLIVERMTAAWVHGALPSPPSRPQFCVPHTARTTASADPRSTVREVVIEADDIIGLGGVRVTTPARTAVDLLRDRTLVDELVVEVVATLASSGAVRLDEVDARLRGGVRVPNIALARARLASVERRAASTATNASYARQPSLTR